MTETCFFWPNHHGCPHWLSIRLFLPYLYKMSIVFLLQTKEFSYLEITDSLSGNDIAYVSGSQPGCRGTLGCRGEVLGVPPVIVFQYTFGLFLV